MTDQVYIYGYYELTKSHGVQFNYLSLDPDTAREEFHDLQEMILADEIINWDSETEDEYYDMLDKAWDNMWHTHPEEPTRIFTHIVVPLWAVLEHCNDRVAWR